MNTTVCVVFALVYLGMILGALPGLALDRSGIALLGGLALVAFGVLTPAEAWNAIDVPTIALLFGLMVVSAQFRLAGFYSALTRRLAAAEMSAERLLLCVVLTSGALSALLVNDIVCLALAPIVVELAARRRLDPVPFLLGVAAGSNVGSAATLIGNPQNMLIGQALGLSFRGYLADALPVAAAGLWITWWVLLRAWRGRLQRDTQPFTAEAPPFDPWQTAKGSLVLAVLVGLFLHGGLPRDVVALAAAGVLLCSRSLASSRFLGLVDWPLLVLFVGLFVVHFALAGTGLVTDAFAAGRAAGFDPAHPVALFLVTPLLSNLVSNVPATMLLLPAAEHPQAGAILALSSTLAGNFLLVGSIANLIVVEQAARLGIRIGWREHARVGVPIGAATLGLAALWLWVRAG
ncbi:MAG: anion transporter [Planctomycetes bacterium]|nr:anion transporter [Planctomycetota bacterium]